MCRRRSHHGNAGRRVGEALGRAGGRLAGPGATSVGVARKSGAFRKTAGCRWTTATVRCSLAVGVTATKAAAVKTTVEIATRSTRTFTRATSRAVVGASFTERQLCG